MLSIFTYSKNFRKLIMKTYLIIFLTYVSYFNYFENNNTRNS